MGEPVGDEFVPGLVCTNCWGLGKPFGNVPTPEQIFVTFAGMTGNGAGGNKTFLGTQLSFNPCQYVFSDANYRGDIIWDAIITELKLFHIPTSLQVFFGFGGACQTIFVDAPGSAVVS